MTVGPKTWPPRRRRRGSVWSAVKNRLKKQVEMVCPREGWGTRPQATNPEDGTAVPRLKRENPRA